jgi:myo-inositol catabolism protein IolS
MKYRTLGSTGIETSVIALGTHQFSGEWGVNYADADVAAILRRAGELGINFIDTAECYGDHLVEAMIGKAIRSERDRWTIATKFGHVSHGNFNKDDAWGADDVRKQLEASLRALGTDHIDLYQFHSGGNAEFFNDDLWTMLQKQVEEGKIRHLGVSFSGELTVKQDLSQIEAMGGIAGAGAVQVVYNRLSREAEEKLLPYCAEHRLGVLARIPLSRGLLSGRYAPGATFKEGDVRAGAPPGFNEERLRQVAEIKRTEVPDGMDMPQWALGWCLAHPAIAAVIVGSKDIAQLEANAAAADIEVEREII